MKEFALVLIGAGVGVTGLLFVGFNSNWYVALGVWLMIWGSNISELGRRK